MIKQLVSFGCSWTYGDELVDPNLDNNTYTSQPENDNYRNAHSFSGLTASHYGWDYKCLAFPGSSLKSMIWNLTWWLEHSSKEEIAESLIIVGLTDESRMSWFNPYFQERDGNWGVHRYMHSIWLQGKSDIKDEPYMPEWREFNKLYMTLSDSTEARNLNYKECVYLFDGIAARYNIPVLQFNVLAQSHEPKLPTLYNQGTSIMEKLVLRDKPRKDPLFNPGKHPNEKGHKIISEYLIDTIDSVIINE